MVLQQKVNSHNCNSKKKNLNGYSLRKKGYEVFDRVDEIISVGILFDTAIDGALEVLAARGAKSLFDHNSRS